MGKRLLQLVFVGAFAVVLVYGATALMDTRTNQTSNQSNNVSGVANMSTIGNVVLVHGAWADGSSWSKVIPLLQEKGYRVTAVQLAETSVADDANITRRVLAMQNGPTILVGHSYGGVVITAAGAGAPNVTGLVYIAAFAPETNEALGALNSRFPTMVGQTKFVPDSGGFLWIDPAAYPEVFAPDVDPAEARVLAAVQKPIAASIFNETAPTAAWHSVPAWYMVSEDDLIINPDLQRFMADRMGATTVSIPSSHVSLLSHPVEVAQLILDAAANTTARATTTATTAG
jgi:pimeloyl-ACP methyl ester carboxylesterase